MAPPSPACEALYEPLMVVYRRQNRAPAECVVRAGKRRSDGLVVVLKYLRYSGIDRELANLDRLRGARNVVQLLDHFPIEDEVGGRVLVFARAKGDPPRGLASIRVYMRGLLEALRSVHAAGLVHRDIKPSNVLFDAGSGEVTLIDFGNAVPSDPPAQCTGSGGSSTGGSEGRPASDGESQPCCDCDHCTCKRGAFLGTRGYLPPRLRTRDAASEATGAPRGPRPADDMFAAGVILAGLAFPHQVNMARWPNLKAEERVEVEIEATARGEAPPACEAEVAADPAAVELIRGLLAVDEANRWDADRALACDFLKGGL